MMKVRYNIMQVTSLMTFANIKGGYNQECKDVYFVRCIGWNEQYLSDLEKIDTILTQRMQGRQGRYHRIGTLPPLRAETDISFYKNVYSNWLDSGKTVLKLAVMDQNQGGEAVMSDALAQLTRLFGRYTAAVSDSIYLNFMIKIFYWLDTVAGVFLKQWSERESYKLICSGCLKKHEYLFLYLLTCLGIDVMLLCPAGDLRLDQGLLDLSAAITLSEVSELVIPACQADMLRPQTAAAVSGGGRPRVQIQQIQRSDRHPPRNAAAPPSVPGAQGARTESAAPASQSPTTTGELGFEALAQLASSVVMIEVRDKKGEPVSTGSGIMIGWQGYILTNYHVIRNGQTFGVRIEDDPKLYQTDEVIKYNHQLDLAVLRINRTLTPIRLYQGSRELARGQKVVAIGSPLGLFNSVSDGIISGFRDINHVGMIQFTAPISHGSSGGAVLNMMGEVIGISTAGFDNGQNINLAVSYKDIGMFVSGFTGS